MRLAGGLAALIAAGWAAQPGEVRIRWGNWAPPPEARISVQANLVEVGAVVRDGRGAPAGGFGAGDFSVLDNGKPQNITLFEEQRSAASLSTPQARVSATASAGEARSIALWLDDVHVGPYGMEKARAAARQLVDGLAPGERIGIFTSSEEVAVELTRDTAALRAAISRLRHSALPGPRELGGCPTLDAYSAYAIAHRLDEEVRQRAIKQAIACNCPSGDEGCIAMQPATVDSVAAQVWIQFKGRSADTLESLLIPVRRLASAPGSRVLLMMSPGFVAGDLDRQSSALMDAALRAHVVVNALNPEGLSTVLEQRRRQLVTSALMADVSSATGGGFIQNSNDIAGGDIAGGARTLAEPPAVRYVLGFAPGEPDGKTHSLKVRLVHGGRYRVEARSAYFSSQEPRHESAQERIDRAAMSNEPLTGIPVITRIAARDPKPGRYILRVDTHVEASVLKFGGDERTHLQQLTFVTVLENAAGEYISGKMAVMDLELSPATLADLRAKGIEAAATFAVGAGRYRVRQVIREAVENRMAATDTPVEVK